LEGWARDGYTLEDIAFRIGVALSTLLKWMRENEDIRKAINDGRELVDYKVENALLKAALGYKTKETKVTTVMRRGVVVEEITETTKTEAAPNVQACKVWLYNRQPKKWRPESARSQSLSDMLDDEHDIKITIERAGTREDELSEVGGGRSVRTGTETDEIDEQWQDEVNSAVSIRRATEEEKAQAKKQAKQKKKSANTDVSYDDDEVSQYSTNAVKKADNTTDPVTSNTMDTDDIDYWPDDWEDEVDDV